MNISTLTDTTNGKTLTVIDDTTAAVIDEFISARDAIAELEKVKKELEARIYEAIGDSDGAMLNGKTRITVSRRQRESIDSKALAEAFPEAYAATRKVTDYRVLMAK